MGTGASCKFGLDVDGNLCILGAQCGCIIPGRPWTATQLAGFGGLDADVTLHNTFKLQLHLWAFCHDDLESFVLKDLFGEFAKLAFLYEWSSPNFCFEKDPIFLSYFKTSCEFKLKECRSIVMKRLFTKCTAQWRRFSSWLRQFVISRVGSADTLPGDFHSLLNVPLLVCSVHFSWRICGGMDASIIVL